MLRVLAAFSPPLGFAAIAGYALAQTAHLDVTLADFVALGSAASALPGAIGWVLYRKWTQTDRDVKAFIERIAALEQRVEPCRCSALREDMRDWISKQGDRMQTSLMNLETRLEKHIDER